MASKPKVLCVGDPTLRDDSVIGHLQESYDVVEVSNSVEAIARLVKGSFASVLIYSDEIAEKLRVGSLLQSERILEGMPDGLVLLDDQNTVFWANDWVNRWSSSNGSSTNATDRRRLSVETSTTSSTAPKSLARHLPFWCRTRNKEVSLHHVAMRRKQLLPSTRRSRQR